MSSQPARRAFTAPRAIPLHLLANTHQSRSLLVEGQPRACFHSSGMVQENDSQKQASTISDVTSSVVEEEFSDQNDIIQDLEEYERMVQEMIETNRVSSAERAEAARKRLQALQNRNRTLSAETSIDRLVNKSEDANGLITHPISGEEVVERVWRATQSLERVLKAHKLFRNEPGLIRYYNSEKEEARVNGPLSNDLGKPGDIYKQMSLMRNSLKGLVEESSQSTEMAATLEHLYAEQEKTLKRRRRTSQTANSSSGNSKPRNIKASCSDCTSSDVSGRITLDPNMASPDDRSIVGAPVRSVDADKASSPMGRESSRSIGLTSKQPKIHTRTNRRALSTKARSETQDSKALTHINARGDAHMVDVSDKALTKRTAIAVSRVTFTIDNVWKLVRDNQLKKGDVLSTARIAGIQAAKKTYDLIPLCHQLALTHVSVHFEVVPPRSDLSAASASDQRDDSPLVPHGGDHGAVWIQTRVETVGQTGVEMEALVAAQVAGLTVYDMCKAVDKSIRLGPTVLAQKSGGKSGLYVHEGWQAVGDR